MMLCLFVEITFHIANILPLLRNAGLRIEVQAKGRSKIEPLTGACDLCVLSFCEIHSMQQKQCSHKDKDGICC